MSIASEVTSRRAARPVGRRIVLRLAGIAVACAGLVAFLALRDTGFDIPSLERTLVGQNPASAERRVSDLEILATPVLHIETVDTLRDKTGAAPAPTDLVLNQPSDFVSVGDRYYALDSGNGRLVEFDKEGRALAALDKALDGQLVLHNAMAMAVREGKLYIADSGAARVIVFDVGSRKVETVMALDKLDQNEASPRPIGIAITSHGDILLSDADNHRVLELADGKLASLAGTGKRDSGEAGLNTPGGLAVDAQDNVYVVDILNSRVVKYAPDGHFLLQFGRPGDTAGAFARPKGVAVDGNGNVYASDSLQAAVEGFDARGEYLGLLGREQPGNKDSDSIFKAPSEMKMIDGRLYVTDRLAGPFVFELSQHP